jgi:hypothetical protein
MRSINGSGSEGPLDIDSDKWFLETEFRHKRRVGSSWSRDYRAHLILEW